MRALVLLASILSSIGAMVAVSGTANAAVAVARPAVSAPRISTPAPRISTPAPRAVSKPSVTRKQTQTRSAYAPTHRYSRDDDVECSTLKYSRHPADRQVYKRYC